MLAAQAVAPDLRLVGGAGFVRLEMASGPDVLRVDLAADTAERLESEPVLVGAVRVETLRDQRANKLVALLGRSELRDLVDLWFIERAGLPAIEGLLDATAKDGGVDPAWLAWAAKQVKIRPLAGLVAPLDIDELTAWRDRLAGALLDAAGAKDE